ncbi:hypothetical protein EDC04DRAFT_2603617 [Pisolithus marmoratus]|nr:hypothetical protein EDC04DRAFT_2603617 [Pisolithus marmoratus]
MLLLVLLCYLLFPQHPALMSLREGFFRDQHSTCDCMAATSGQPSRIIPQQNAHREALGAKKVVKSSQLTKALTSTGSIGWVVNIIRCTNEIYIILTQLNCHVNVWSQCKKLPGSYRQKAEFLITLQNHGCLIWTQPNETGCLVDMSLSHEAVTTAMTHQLTIGAVQSNIGRA